MKRLFFLPLLLAALCSWGQPLVMTSEAEWALMRERFTAGTRTARLFGRNVDNDSLRLRQFADAFRASPRDSGVGNSLEFDLWGGFPAGLQPGAPGPGGERYPHAVFVQGLAASTVYRLTGDTSYGMPVVRTLLAQTQVLRSRIWLWGTRADMPRPTADGAGPVGPWLARLSEATANVWPLLTPTQRAQLDWYQRRSAVYLGMLVHGYLVGYLPGRWDGNLTQRTGFFAAEGVRSLGDYAVWWQPDASYMRVYDGVFSYNHRNADGTLSNRVSFASHQYRNTRGMMMLGAMLTGCRLGNDTLLRLSRQYARELLAFWVNPDGSNNEGLRNGRPISGVAHVSFGYMNYAPINFQYLIELADVLARNGDTSVYALRVMDGQHGTQVPAGGQPKSIARMLDFWAGLVTGKTVVYYDKVDPGNQVGPVSWRHTRVLGGVTYGYEAQFDYMLATAERYYPSRPLWREAYMRNRGLNNATAGEAAYAYGGAMITKVGWLLRYGQSAGRIVYPTVGRFSLEASAVAPVGAVSWTFRAVVRQAPQRWEWVYVSGPKAATGLLNGPSLTLNPSGLGRLARGVYRWRLRAVYADRVEAREVSLTVP